MRLWVTSLTFLLAAVGWSQDQGYKNAQFNLYQVDLDPEVATAHVNYLPAPTPVTNPPLPAGAFIICQQGAVAAGPPGIMARGFWNSLSALGNFVLSIEHENDEEVNGAAVTVRWHAYAFATASAYVIPEGGQTCNLAGSYATGFSQAWFVNNVSRSVMVEGTSPQSQSFGDVKQTNSMNNPQWVSLGSLEIPFELGPGLISSEARGFVMHDFPNSIVEGVVVSTGSSFPLHTLQAAASVQVALVPEITEVIWSQ